MCYSRTKYCASSVLDHSTHAAVDHIRDSDRVAAIEDQRTLVIHGAAPQSTSRPHRRRLELCHLNVGRSGVGVFVARIRVPDTRFSVRFPPPRDSAAAGKLVVSRRANSRAARR